MTLNIGDRIPSVTLWTMGGAGPQSVSSDDLCRGKRVVLFGLPGAFTPTCSARHLPGFVEKADAIRAKGVDAIVCLSVNDAFVMDAWGQDQRVGDKVLMVADGNADFAKAAGLDLDMSSRGFGVRSHRYAMVIHDCTVEALNVEEPGRFEVSDAETILRLL
jgi:peroxiredoxin